MFHQHPYWHWVVLWCIWLGPKHSNDKDGLPLDVELEPPRRTDSTSTLFDVDAYQCC